MGQEDLTPPLLPRPTAAPAGLVLTALCSSPGSMSELPPVQTLKATESSWGSSWGLRENTTGSGKVPSIMTGALRMSPSSGGIKDLCWNESSSPMPSVSGLPRHPMAAVGGGSCSPDSPCYERGEVGGPRVPACPCTHRRCLRQVSANSSPLPLDPIRGNGERPARALFCLRPPPSLTAQISCYDWNVTSQDVNPNPANKSPARQVTRRLLDSRPRACLFPTRSCWLLQTPRLSPHATHRPAMCVKRLWGRRTGGAS